MVQVKENINIQHKTKILIIARGHSGSSLLLDTLVSLFRDNGFENEKTFVLYEPDHQTTLNNYKPFIQHEKYIKKMSNNTRLMFQQKYQYRAGIIDSVFYCNLTKNFDTRIGIQYYRLCKNNGLSGNCKMSKLEKICQKSQIMIAKSINFDYQSIQYLKITNDKYHGDRSKLYFVLLIRNPFDTIESQLAAHWHNNDLTKPINMICKRFFHNTVIPLLNQYNFNNDIKKNTDEYFIPLHTILYENLKLNFVEAVINMTYFLKDVFDNVSFSKIIDDVTLYKNIHLPTNCSYNQSHTKTNTQTLVQCDNQARNNKSKHLNIRQNEKFDGSRTFEDCQPFCEYFNYQIPAELI